MECYLHERQGCDSLFWTTASIAWGFHCIIGINIKGSLKGGIQFWLNVTCYSALLIQRGFYKSRQMQNWTKMDGIQTFYGSSFISFDPLRSEDNSILFWKYIWRVWVIEQLAVIIHGVIIALRRIIFHS